VAPAAAARRAGIQFRLAAAVAASCRWERLLALLPPPQAAGMGERSWPEATEQHATAGNRDAATMGFINSEFAGAERKGVCAKRQRSPCWATVRAGAQLLALNARLAPPRRGDGRPLTCQRSETGQAQAAHRRPTGRSMLASLDSRSGSAPAPGEADMPDGVAQRERKRNPRARVRTCKHHEPRAGAGPAGAVE
jgi:hypothetical protein